MKFGQLENALVQISHLDEDRVGAFKARVRNLRRFNCPSTEKKKIGHENLEYTYQHVIELAVALALERNGLPPKFSAARALHWAPLIIRSIAFEPEKVHYLAIIASFNLIEGEYLSMIGWGIEFIKDVLDGSPAAIVINTSMLVSQVDAALRGGPLPQLPEPIGDLSHVEGLHLQRGDRNKPDPQK